MYLIHAAPKKIKLILNILKKVEELKVYETKLPDYLFVTVDPARFLPEEFVTAARIEYFKGSYTTFLKDAGRISELLKKEIYPPGTPVRIVGGRYEGFSGIVKGMSGEKYNVEVSVWGAILRAECPPSEVKKTEARF